MINLEFTSWIMASLVQDDDAVNVSLNDVKRRLGKISLLGSVTCAMVKLVGLDELVLGDGNSETIFGIHSHFQLGFPIWGG